MEPLLLPLPLLPLRVAEEAAWWVVPRLGRGRWLGVAEVVVEVPLTWASRCLLPRSWCWASAARLPSPCLASDSWSGCQRLDAASSQFVPLLASELFAGLGEVAQLQAPSPYSWSAYVLVWSIVGTTVASSASMVGGRSSRTRLVASEGG